MGFKVVFLLVALWTGGDGNDFYIFDKPKFKSERECVLYVMKHVHALDNHVNEVYESESPNRNKFWCLDSEELKKKLEKTFQYNI